MNKALTHSIYTLTTLTFVTSALYMSAAHAEPKRFRPEADKPVKTKIEDHHRWDEVVVKFKDDVAVDLNAIEGLGIPTKNIRPYFERTKSELDNERQQLRGKEKKHLPQLSQYFHVRLPKGFYANEACDLINDLNRSNWRLR